MTREVIRKVSKWVEKEKRLYCEGRGIGRDVVQAELEGDFDRSNGNNSRIVVKEVVITRKCSNFR